MLSQTKIFLLSLVVFAVQINSFAADLKSQEKEGALEVPHLKQAYPQQKITRKRGETLSVLFSQNLAETVDGKKVDNVTQEVFTEERTKKLNFVSKLYDGYLQTHRQDINAILQLKIISPKDLHKIDRVVSKAVRDVCSHEQPSYTFSKTRNETVRLPKQIALNNLKRLLDHVAMCKDRKRYSDLATQEHLKMILGLSSMALVSCKEYPPKFEISHNNMYSSVSSDKLKTGRRFSLQQGEMLPKTQAHSEHSANPVQRVEFEDSGVTAFIKPCNDISPYAEEQNKKFAGINEKWISLFSVRHKHEFNFNVPAIIIDNEKQEFSATPEGLESLHVVQENKDIIEKIPVELVQQYFLLEFLFNFSDAHLGNIRVGKNSFGEYYLISIDHGEALQILYELPGTASLRFGNLLELFTRESELPMAPVLRELVQNLNPNAEVEFIRTQLKDDLDALAQAHQDDTIEHQINRKFDHFRLNLEFLKALANAPDATFSDAFELRRGQFTLNIFRSASSRAHCRCIRNFYMGESLVQRAIKVIQTTRDESAFRKAFSPETFRQFEPSCEHLLTEEDRERKSAFVIPPILEVAMSSRLDEEFFLSFGKIIENVLLPMVKSGSYHRMTNDELSAYQSVGF